MKKYFLFLSFVLSVAMLHSSCRMNVLKGEGKKITSTPAVSSFNAIDVELSLKVVVNVQPGAQPSVTINGYENLLKHIKATVVNNTLKIHTDLDATWTIESDEVEVQVTVPSINALTLTGAPDAEVHGIITGSDFKLDISGASSVKLDNVSTDHFSIDVSGAGDVEVKGGTVKKAEYEINGAGEVKAFPLQTNETIATISGAGNSTVTALEKLTANISGAGTIKYKGHPAVSQEVSGAGSISDAN